MVLPRISTGIKGLDKITGGGFFIGSNNMLSGGPGTGKTLICLQYLLEGARNGEKGLYISFEETKEELLLDAKSIKLPLEEYLKKDKILVEYYEPFKAIDLDTQLPRLVKIHKVKRIVIDSASIFGLFLQDKYKIRKKLHTLFSTLKKLNVTTLITVESGQDAPIDSSETGNRSSTFGVEEYISDTVLLLHYSGLGGGFDRTIQIMKMRRSNHLRGLFPMKIDGTKGIVINPTETV